MNTLSRVVINPPFIDYVLGARPQMNIIHMRYSTLYIGEDFRDNNSLLYQCAKCCAADELVTRVVHLLLICADLSFL